MVEGVPLFWNRCLFRNLYRLLGQPAFARQQYQAALNLHQALGARVLMAWSYYGLAIVAAGNGEYALARQSLDRAFNLVGDTNDSLLYGLLCSVQATTLALEEVAPRAERVAWFARAQAAFERIGHRRFVARTLGNIGHQLLWDGQWQEAEAILQRALDLGQELQDRRSVASMLETLAELHSIQGKYEISQSYLAEALALVEDHDRFVELQVRLALARLQWQQGQLVPARAEFEQVVALASETEAKQWQVVAQLHLAEISIAERQWDAVEELLPGCQSAVETLNNLGLVGHLRFVEGSLALARQDLAAAQEALGQARSMFEVSGRRWWFGRTHFQLAEVLAQAGQSNAAHDVMHQAEQVFQALAAHPFLQQVQAWFQHYPLPTEKAATADPLTLVLPETDGVGRLLRAAPFRDVVLHELFVLLQTELPHCHLTLSEQTKTGALRRLFKSNAPRPKSQPGILRLEPWRCLPLLLELRPAPVLTTKLGTLLQAAQNSLGLCAARERDTFTTASEQQAVHLDRPLPGLLYQSQAMRQLAADIYNIQGSAITILLLGETGTGKELIAQAIHTLGDRRDRAFLPFNCATLSLERAESQLFGHRKGAFTGAWQAEPGVIRTAERGTLFLDEIGDLPLDVQPKLLRFLQSKEIHPLGASQPVRVNVRLIAATHHSLEALVEQGKFREDLHYRLNVLPLHVPPLRQRREDIPLLVQYFLTQYSTEMKKPGTRIAPEALDDLMLYAWPGNVRELENEIHRLVALLPAGAVIRSADLAPACAQPNTPMDTRGTMALR